MRPRRYATRISAFTFFLLLGLAGAQTKPRARDLGVPFDGTPGPLNAITDVKGVEVGHTTLISGAGPLQVGVGPVRTGVTAVLPRGKDSTDPVFAGWFTLNGNGEMTGTTWLEESDANDPADLDAAVLDERPDDQALNGGVPEIDRENRPGVLQLGQDEEAGDGQENDRGQGQKNAQAGLLFMRHHGGPS